jgi:acylphosphatase
LSDQNLVQAQVYITGRVQGVNFRYYTRQQAVELGVSGWVRNVRDGRVEAVFQGDQEQVAKILEWCQRGPPSARVVDVAVEWQAPAEILSGFEILFW